MAKRIILSGASSVGKTTVACDWCSEHKDFVHIQEVARDVMRKQSITRDDMVKSLDTKEKKLFLNLQLEILKEQNKRELDVSSYISDRGPDPLIYVYQYVSRDAAENLARSPAGQACLKRYRTSLVCVLSPLLKAVDDGFRLVPSTEEQSKFTTLLCQLLYEYRVPFIYIKDANRHRRIVTIEHARNGIYSLELWSEIDRVNIPFVIPEKSKEQGLSLRMLHFTADKVQCSFKPFPPGKSNRMVHRYGRYSFVLASFDGKVAPDVVVKLLKKGLLINGEEYSFLGCSSSGLRSRTCYLYKGTKVHVQTLLEKCGAFSKIRSVSVRIKRIGLLFSEAYPTGIQLSYEDTSEVEDIVKGEFNFTDGCGAISKDLAMRIVKQTKLVRDYFPCVYQIRYQGCKGVVMIDPGLKENEIIVRKSMRKFDPGIDPFPEVWLCNHSRPYSYGHLNKQFIMLLSGLGVGDEVFLAKQTEHFSRIELMTVDPTTAFEMLQWNNQPDLAARVSRYSQVQLKDDEIIQSRLSHLKSKLVEKLEKLHLLISKSRTVFGVCDPLEVLDYGECFFRPTVRGDPCTLSGYVIVAKSPCYLLGDVRKLKAVSDAHRVQQLEHLVDCIVFPTKGKQPHPNEIAGSDLDGDEYFVCWEEDLMIPHTSKPYHYPSSDSQHTPQFETVQYFAQQNQQSRVMGRIDNVFNYWANKKGVNCVECERLGMLFANSVDSAKTGIIVTIPRELVPPKHDNDNNIGQDKVWTCMKDAALIEKRKLSKSIVMDSVPGAVTEDFVWGLLQDEEVNISEFQIFTFVKRWCFSQDLTDDEILNKLVEFSDCINFGKFTVEQQKSAMSIGIPRQIVTNALNKSQLLTPDMLQYFSLDSPHCGWQFYFRLDSTRFEGHHMLRALERYPEALVIFQLPNTVTLALHFLTSISRGLMIIGPGAIASYFFSPHFGLSQRCVLGSEYTIELSDEMLQLYRSSRGATFIKLAFDDKDRSDLATFDVDKISVDLTRFKQDILSKLKHPTVKKQKFHTVELFVKSAHKEPAYFDILLAELSGEVLETVTDSDVEEVPFEEEVDGCQHYVGNLELCSRDIALGQLQAAAQEGNIVQYNAIIQFFLSTQRQSEQFCSELQSSLLALLTTMVANYSHKPYSANTEDCLQSIIVALLRLCFQTGQSKLLLLDRLCRLKCPSLANLVVQGVQALAVADYFGTVSDWQLWCFLPNKMAHSFLDIIKPTSVSIPTGKEFSARVGDSPSEDTIHTATAQYTVYFANLLLHQFIDDVCETRNQRADHTIKLLRLCNLKAIPFNMGENQPLDKVTKWRASFYKPEGVSSTKFTVGTHVIVSPMKVLPVAPVPIVFMCIGRITDIIRQPTNISLELQEPIPLCLKLSAKQSKGHWQLSIVSNVTAFKRSLNALQRLFYEKISSTQLLPLLVYPQVCTEDRRSNFNSEHFAQSQPIEGACQSPRITEWSTFNESQRSAINASLTQDITLIHGPPGTGKTHVASEIVLRAVQLEYSTTKGKVLVAAETNMAVDNLTRKLLQKGVIVVRIGNVEHMSDDVRHVSLQHQLQMTNIEHRDKGHFASVRDILNAAEVIATTCTGAGDIVLKEFAFPFVLIDEATQATEPVSLIPLVSKCKQLVLIGDPQQLPPIVTCRTETSHGLSLSLFHRLYRCLPSFFLEEQYRMHPALAEFPSKEFYAGQLKSAAGLEKRTSNINVIWRNKAMPRIFINVELSREQRLRTSFQNIPEAEFVVKVVVNILNKNINQREIAVLTPYAGQVKCIRERLGPVAKCVEVCSVDGFQGREKDMVIFSTVRTRTLGFTADNHRINVLLTRAKYGVIGIGSHGALTTDPVWKSWLSQVGVEESESFLRYLSEPVRTGAEVPKANACRDIRRGCIKSDKCRFAHSQVELDECIKTKPSRSKASSSTSNTKSEVRTRPIIPRTGEYRLCKFIDSGCRSGKSCTYAHSQAELQEWTRDSKKRAPKKERRTGKRDDA